LYREKVPGLFSLRRGKNVSPLRIKEKRGKRGTQASVTATGKKKKEGALFMQSSSKEEGGA